MCFSGAGHTIKRILNTDAGVLKLCVHLNVPDKSQVTNLHLNISLSLNLSTLVWSSNLFLSEKNLIN